MHLLTEKAVPLFAAVKGNVMEKLEYDVEHTTLVLHTPYVILLNTVPRTATRYSHNLNEIPASRRPAKHHITPREGPTPHIAFPKNLAVDVWTLAINMSKLSSAMIFIFHKS